MQISKKKKAAKKGPKNFLKTTYIDTVLDAFSNVLVVHYRKIDGSPNVVAQVVLL